MSMQVPGKLSYKTVAYNTAVLPDVGLPPITRQVAVVAWRALRYQEGDLDERERNARHM